MKATKTFFNEDNRLNKGYSKLPNPRQTSDIHNRKKFEHILPPVDVMSEYEAMHPGILEKMILMAEQEQQHRHSIDILNIKEQANALQANRSFALRFASILAVISITVLAAFGITKSLMFILLPCAAALGIVLLYRRCKGKKCLAADPSCIDAKKPAENNPNVKQENFQKNRRSPNFKRR